MSWICQSFTISGANLFTQHPSWTSSLMLGDDCRCALAMAHPGHELLVYGWMAQARPRVYVLTDGSGRNTSGRLPRSERLLAETGSTSSGVFGRFTDLQIYSKVLRRESDELLRLADELARDWYEHGIDLVIGDAYEGAIMAHDLWRGVIDRALALVNVRRTTTVQTLAFSLEGQPLAKAATNPAIHSQLELDQTMWQRKIRALLSYHELKQEVQFAFRNWGTEPYKVETFLVNVPNHSHRDWPQPPAYELHGEAQVRAGVYPITVRYLEHVRPILERLEASPLIA